MVTSRNTTCILYHSYHSLGSTHANKSNEDFQQFSLPTIALLSSFEWWPSGKPSYNYGHLWFKSPWLMAKSSINQGAMFHVSHVSELRFLSRLLQEVAPNSPQRSVWSSWEGSWWRTKTPGVPQLERLEKLRWIWHEIESIMDDVYQYVSISISLCIYIYIYMIYKLQYIYIV